MRIRHMAFGLGLGGTERAAQNFALETARAGHDTDVVVLSDGPRRAILENAGISISILDPQGEVPLALAPADVVVVHSHALPAEAVERVLFASGRPVVGEINVFSEPTPWMSKVDVSFQLSPWAHWLYVQRGGDRARSSTLAYPVDVESFWFAPEAAASFRLEHGLDDSAVIIGRIGQPLINKWSPWLVPSLSTLMGEGLDIHAVLVGAPQELESAARRELKPERLTVIDRLGSDAQLRGAYSAIDVFAHAARQGESFGYVLTEAALSQSSIVTMATPWADNSQGFVAGPSAKVAITPSGFTDHLRQTVIETQVGDSRAVRGDRGRRHVMDNFAASEVTAVMLQTLLRERHRRPVPETSELSGPAYFGSDHYFGDSLLKGWPRSRLRACFSRQESLRWLASNQLDAVRRRLR